MKQQIDTRYGIQTRLASDCLPCILGVTAGQIPQDAPEEKKFRFLQEVYALMSRAERTLSPPEVMRDVQALLRETFGRTEDFAAVKSFFNQKLLGYTEQIREGIRQADDPLLRAVQYSMCGNYIDLGTPGAVTEEELERILSESERIAVPKKTWARLREELAHTRDLVYLLDNCGEIVLDKILMEEMKREFSGLRITAIVRGAEVLNDVTWEDAEEVQLYEAAEVLSSGSDVPGTRLETLSGEAREKMLASGLIWSKGQGNFECLNGCGLNVYYFFLCKCPLFAERFGVPLYAGLVLSERDLA